MTTRTLKHINPLSVATTVGLLYGLLGIVGGVFTLLASGFSSYGFGFCLGYPVGLAVAGFVSGIIIGFAYNVAASFTGGIKLEVQ
jgi:hypothetical protein